MNKIIEKMPSILLIEDDPLVRKSISQALIASDFDVIAYSSADEGAWNVIDKSCDVIVTDINLPSISGVDFLHLIKQGGYTIPVILITGGPSVETAAEAVRAGAFDYLLKPLSAEKIRSTVKNAVNFKLLTDENNQYRLELERLVAERTRQLQESEREKSIILDTMAESVMFLDPDKKIIWANRKAWQSMTDGPENESELTCMDVLYPSVATCEKCPVTLSLNTKTTSKATIDYPNGETWQAISSPVTSEKGELIGIVDVRRNITQEKVAEMTYRKNLQALASELIISEERQRKEISTLLHDGTCQDLTVMKVKLQLLRKQFDDSDTIGRIDDLINQMEKTVEETRDLMFDLSPPILYEIGLSEAVAWLTERFQKEHGISIDYFPLKRSLLISEDNRVLAFQITRELLFNVVKHSKAESASVRLVVNDQSIIIEVEDKGIGFEPCSKEEKRGWNSGFGLFSIEERLSHFGGSLTLESEPGKGTRATVCLPYQRIDNREGDE